jgi:hypothetical protein
VRHTNRLSTFSRSGRSSNSRNDPGHANSVSEFPDGGFSPSFPDQKIRLGFRSRQCYVRPAFLGISCVGSHSSAAPHLRCHAHNGIGIGTFACTVREFQQPPIRSIQRIYVLFSYGTSIDNVDDTRQFYSLASNDALLHALFIRSRSTS